ncbi:MAG TPA: hypothetical protein VF625_18860 [Longimicrobium sp.]|jgi:hypothetical protein
MKILKPVFTLLAVAAIAGFAGTAEARPDPVTPKPAMTAPIANIHLVTKRPVGSPGAPYVRWTLDAQGSYDPDNDPITYYWSSSCVYIPNGNAYTYTFDVADGDTCVVNLYVFDATNQSNDNVSVYQTTITY